MLELVALIFDSSMYFLKQGYRLAATVGTLLTPSNLALSTPKFRLGEFVESGVGNRLAVGQGGEIRQTHINPNLVVEGGKSVGCILDREADIPLSALPLERGGLDFSDQGSVELYLDIPDSLNPKHLTLEPNAVAVGGEGNAVEPSTGLEPWVTGILVKLDPAEERLERLVHPAKHILGAGIICKAAVLGRTYLPKLAGLVVVVERLTASLIGIPTLLESSIVESASLAKLSIQGDFLEVCRE